jgi:hypothetical protein
MRRAAWVKCWPSLLLLLVGPLCAEAQQPRQEPGRNTPAPSWGTQVERDPAAPQQQRREPAASGTPRPAPPAPAGAPGTIALGVAAWLTEQGPALEQGLVWRVFTQSDQTGSGEPPRLRLVQTYREARPVLRLTPGDYAINVAYGRAQLTRQITIAPGGPAEERFVLNAGGLIVRAVLASGEAVPEMSVSYDIYVAEGEQHGTRPKVVSGARPGLVVRLTAGQYHLVSVYGDANAIVRADVSVEPGKLTEATISHHSAKVSFKLVSRQGGEAQADTRWMVQNPQGETIVESSGALPSHILAAGSYVVIARNGGRSFRREFVVEPGDPLQVEVVMQ